MKDGEGNLEPWRIVFKVTVRTITAKSEQLLIPAIEADTYWAGLDEYPAMVLDLYHGHGTSKQFHDELKSDMDVERLPSGKFKTNATIVQTAMMAFNTIYLIGQEILVKEMFVAVKEQRWRLRTVLAEYHVSGV